MKKILFLVSILVLSNINLHSQMVLSGDATGGCNCYTLTDAGGQAGSIWSPETIDLNNSFDFTFTVNLGASDGGADGIVFVLRQSGTSTGTLGSLLGYAGITNSVGVEIDTWNSGPGVVTGDIPADHVGMDANGNVNHALVPAIGIDNIEDGDDHLFRAVWDPLATELTIFLDGVELFSYTEDLVTSYFGGDPNVYFGWTGSTGGAFNIQTVCLNTEANFSYEPAEPCPGQEIIFTNTSVGDFFYDGTALDYSWEFESGETSDLETPTYTYDSEGTKTVELTVTDITGCSNTISYSFDVRNLEPEIATSDDVSCFGSTDGSATVIIEPIEDDYTFSWDDPLAQTSATATDLPPGTFTVTVTNLAGCMGDISVTIEEPSPLTFGDIEIFDASCDEDDGTVNLSGEGGTPGYEFSFNGEPFVGTSTYTDLAGGDYDVTIRDANGCLFSEVITISSSGLGLDYIFNPPTCFGFSDASVTITSDGGDDGITFEITDVTGSILNIDNSNTANSLNTGWYYLFIEDESGCFQNDSVFIPEPGQLDAELNLSDILCYGDATGWAEVDTVLNWQGDYGQIAYFWSPNTSGEEGIGADSTYNMTAGEYILTINDENGCSRVFEFEITQPDSLYFNDFGIIPATCRLFGYQNGNGVVFASVNGGVPDYTFLWTNLDNGETSVNSTWGGLNPDSYTCDATDNNGCVISRTVFLDSINPEAIFTVVSDQLNSDCQGIAPVEVEFYNNSINFVGEVDPDPDTTGFWNLNAPEGDWTLTEDINEVFDTIYGSRGQTYNINACLVMLNKNGCSDTTCKDITIFEDTQFEAVNVFTPNNDGINDVFTFELRAASIAEFNCIIVNRWGVKVAELNSITDSWDGTDQNGDPCKNGTYFYTYTAVTDNSVQLNGQGNIQLVGAQ